MANSLPVLIADAAADFSIEGHFLGSLSIHGDLRNWRRARVFRSFASIT
jgi:hypothetical protein